MSEIKEIYAREVLDSRGNPTIETQVRTSAGAFGRAIVPSGASTGIYEAVELRDNDAGRYMGKEVLSAVKNVNTEIFDALCGKDVFKQTAIDKTMVLLDGTDNKSRLGANAILSVSMAVNTEIFDALCGKDVFKQTAIDKTMVLLDGTDNKSRLGANAILSVSMACARAAAHELHMPLYRYLGGVSASMLPLPMMNILNGGAHADNQLDFQEFMIVPFGAKTYKESLRMGSEVYHSLRAVLKKEGLETGLGDEGGYAPKLKGTKEALELLVKASEQAGYEPGSDIKFSIDAAASEFYREGRYELSGEHKKLDSDGMIRYYEKLCEAEPGSDIKFSIDAAASEFYREGRYELSGEHKKLDSDGMIRYYEKLCEAYPIYSIEDGLAEEDWDGWKAMTQSLGKKTYLIGDDLFVTKDVRLRMGIGRGAANGILIKPNQVGTVTETLETVDIAKQSGYKTIISHRSGESEDTFIADFAVAVNSGHIKTGAPARGERTAKYNRLLRIEDELGSMANFRSFDCLLL